MAPKVLIVEDDDAIRHLLEAVLARSAIPCDHADDGSSALPKILAEEYAAILLDLLLPGVDGFEILCNLRKNRPELLPRVIVITAAADVTWRACEDVRLARCVLRKPLDIAQLVAEITDCVRQSGSVSAG